MIKLITYSLWALNAEDLPINLYSCDECGALIDPDDKEKHQKWHTKVWLLDPQHRMLR